MDKHEEEQEKRRREEKLNAHLTFVTLDKIINQQKKRVMETLKENAKANQNNQVNEELLQEKERRIVVEASLSALQIELREALQKISKLERKEERRLEKKRRSIARRRRDQVNCKISD